MTTLSEKVTSALKHPVTGFVSGLYLTGVGMTAIRYLNNNKEKHKNVSEKVIFVSWLTGFAGAATLLLGGRTAYQILKNN
jgi:hypothetical protein